MQQSLQHYQQELSFFSNERFFPHLKIAGVRFYCLKKWYEFYTGTFSNICTTNVQADDVLSKDARALVTSFFDSLDAETWAQALKAQDTQFLGRYREALSEALLISAKEVTIRCYIDYPGTKERCSDGACIDSWLIKTGTSSYDLFLLMHEWQSSEIVAKEIERTLHAYAALRIEDTENLLSTIDDYHQSHDLKRLHNAYICFETSSVFLSLWKTWAAERALQLNRAGRVDHALPLADEYIHDVVEHLRMMEQHIQELYYKKRLFERRDWILSLSSLDESVYPFLASCDSLWEEWSTLGFLPESPVQNKEDRLRYLHQHPMLPLDTRHVSVLSRYTILSAMERKDVHDFGLLIGGDNEDMLRTLAPMYSQSVSCCYIDPPYNTSHHDRADRMSYHDGFERDLWSSFMNSRLKQAIPLLAEDAAFFASIDEKELSSLLSLVEHSSLSYQGVFTWRRTRTGGHLSKSFNQLSDFMIVATRNPTTPLFGGSADPSESQPLTKAKNRYGTLRIPPGRLYVADMEDGVLPVNYQGGGRSPVRLEVPLVIHHHYNQDVCVISGPFVWTQKKLDEECRQGARFIVKRAASFCPRFLRTPRMHKPFPSLPGNSFTVGTNEDGSKRLYDLFGKRDLLSYPKPRELLERCIESRAYFDDKAIVLDYFAGSGTTAEAALVLGDRASYRVQALLGETRATCEEVIIPRLKKVMFSREWKAGVPSIEAEREARKLSCSYIALEDFLDAWYRVHYRQNEIDIFDQAMMWQTSEGAAWLDAVHIHLGMRSCSYRIDKNNLFVEGQSGESSRILVVWGPSSESTIETLEKEYGKEEVEAFAACYSQFPLSVHQKRFRGLSDSCEAFGVERRSNEEFSRKKVA